MSAPSRKADYDLSISLRQARMSGPEMLQGSARPGLSGRNGPGARVKGRPAPLLVHLTADRREEPIEVI